MKQPIKTRIKRLVRSRRVLITLKTFKEWGMCVYADTLLVKKSLSRRNQIVTLIHEAIHYLEPCLGEDEVLRLEKEVSRSLTEEDKEFFSAILEKAKA